MKKILLWSLLIPCLALAAPQDYGVSYDIVYVRYPGTPIAGDWAIIPQGEQPYEIHPGADLVLLKPNGTTEDIVDCDNTCSVMDPYISYDGTTVYYSKMVGLYSGTNVPSLANRSAAGYLYKVVLTGGAPYTEVQLTFPESFASSKYAGNTEADDDLDTLTNIRDMTPIPLSDGRLLFTSNRSAHIHFDSFNHFERHVSQHMFTMDDHDGTKNTSELANIRQIDFSNMNMVQHPMQLKDGRILFSTWQNFATKDSYAMTELFTMYPDGSNLQQFTEPHDHRKNVIHFITQLDNTDVVGDVYYNSNNFGYGILARFPVTIQNGQYLKEEVTPESTGTTQFDLAERNFSLPNTLVLTPHTWGADRPAPNQTGKYAMPSWAPGGDMLVAYSTGYVNHQIPVCGTPGTCEDLKSGIYLHIDATTTQVSDPTNTAQLAPMIDDPNFNEIWPRAVVSYNTVFGQAAPDIIPNFTRESSDTRVGKGEMAAMLGTSSMLNKESSVVELENEQYNKDGIINNSKNRELTRGQWVIQGTDVGLFQNSDVYGVRILATPENTATSAVALSAEQKKYIGYCNPDCSIAVGTGSNYRSRYGSATSEQWKILAEFPFSYTNITDPQGNPDTSWLAKIPANTPTTIQAIDANGMTLYSEMTWRALRPGENRSDCKGCHAHSTEVTPLDLSLTEAGKGTAITGITGLADSDPLINQGFWDLTGDTTTLIAEGGGVDVVQGRHYEVEFYADIKPIIDAKCVSCHTAGQSNGGLELDGTGDNSPYLTLVRNNTTGEIKPQMTKYIRTPQARNSLFVWVAWGQRLDGRTNANLTGDIDYPDAHPALSLTFDEKRKIARWVDMGSVANIPGMPDDGFQYEDDFQLPQVHIFSPTDVSSPLNQRLVFGVADAQSDVDWSSLSITYYDVATPGTVVTISAFDRDDKGIITANLPTLTQGNDYVFKISVSDTVGNTAIESRRFTAAANVTLPTAPSNVSVSIQ